MTARHNVVKSDQKKVERISIYGRYELTRRVAFGTGAGYVLAALVVSVGGIAPVWVLLAGVIVMLAIWITGR